MGEQRGRRSYLLPGEDVLVEVELDLLVGDVDAQLLEGVPLEVLKAEDVKDPDVEAVVPLAGGGVCVEGWRGGGMEWWRNGGGGRGGGLLIRHIHVVNQCTVR